MAPSKD
jgi:thioredoxin reductase (NADPH)